MRSEIDDLSVLSSSERTKNGLKRTVGEMLDAIISSMDDERAYSGIDPMKLRSMIGALQVLPEEGDGWDGMMESVKNAIMPHMLRTWSPSYMPHLHSPVLIETIASELMIAAFNSSMDSWDQGPAATEIEIRVINELLQLYGYGSGADGTFTSGGSQSNISAMIIHRDRFLSELGYDVKKNGLPGIYSRLRIYVSGISHFSFDKGSHIMGLGYDAVVKLPVDGCCRIDIAEAERIIKKDKENGLIPFMIAATAGTTDFGSIDDIKALRSIADEYGLYLHADAAYGSGAILSSYADRVSALSLADSITVDFHKMFLLPISASALLVRDGSELDAFQLHADYLNREEDEEDGYINLVGKSMQTTRRFDALKVYMAFRMRGRDGYRKLMDTMIGNAAYFYDRISSDEEFIAPVEPELSSVVFALRGGDERNRKARRSLMQEGIIIGQTVYRDQVMLKFTLLNPALTHEHIDMLIARIRAL